MIQRVVLALIAAVLGPAFLAALLIQSGKIAGISRDSGDGLDRLRDLPAVLATVNGHTISRDEVNKELAGLSNPTAADASKVVRRRIDAHLLAEAAGLFATGPVPETEAGLEGQLAQQVLVQPEEVEAFWARNRETFSGDFFRVRRVARLSESDARAAKQALLARDASAAAIPAEAEEEWVGPGQLDDGLEEVLHALKPGEVSEPIRVNGVYHVVWLLGRKASQEVSVADWLPRLTAYLRAERWYNERARWLRIREAYAALKVAPELDFPTAAAGVEFFRTHPDVAAVVNGRLIMEAELAKRMDQLRAMAGKSSRPPGEQDRKRVLAQLIQHALLSEEAKTLGISVSESEIEERFQALRSRFPSDQAVDAMFRANATTREEWRRSMREGWLAIKTESAVAARLPVPEAEIEDYWAQNRGGLVRDRVKLLSASFQTEREAFDALEQLRAGKPFESLAEQAADRRPNRLNISSEGPWFTHDMLPHELWTRAWNAEPKKVQGPFHIQDAHWLLRVDERQEAKAQTLADHRDHVVENLQRIHWSERERARWMLGLMDRARIWNRFDVAFRLNQRLPPVAGLRWDGRPILIVVALGRGCGAGVCDSMVDGWAHPIRLHVTSPSQAEQAARVWGLPSVPWTFAVDGRGVVVGEYPGPVTREMLERLASLLERATRSAGTVAVRRSEDRDYAG